MMTTNLLSTKEIAVEENGLEVLAIIPKSSDAIRAMGQPFMKCKIKME